ncbi:hypothetical protein [Desulfurispira natronophila]|uniref:Uncharacterized protein n=1 Tax=Desulfurispira natronophila TaxID=682562 RepID=A0A7W7Y589_9BACT|nr:hypothetical protein [Desulfurispira natronophila]MBB5022328.1 hypothetical protein [Desulfurispira natronophila]
MKKITLCYLNCETCVNFILYAPSMGTGSVGKGVVEKSVDTTMAALYDGLALLVAASVKAASIFFKHYSIMLRIAP